MIENYEEFAATCPSIGKAGMQYQLNRNETLQCHIDHYTIHHPKRCELTITSFWISNARFCKILKRWRRYGTQSKGMKL